MLTVLELIKSAGGYLEKQGVENPRLNAEHLLAHVLGKKKRLDLYMEFDRPLGEPELAPMRELVRRRGQGIPLQHLLGTAEFYGREFKVDGRVLIPRPETEELVEMVLGLARGFSEESRPRLLDIGTGSGAIAITLALELENFEIAAVDVSPEALEVARENARLLGANRVVFFEGDLLDPVGEGFDGIVANLPYIPRGEMAGLQREVRHDPTLALEGGEVGTEIMERLIREAIPKFSASGGFLALEAGAGQCDLLMRVLSEQNYTHVEARSDFRGVERFIIARYGQNSSARRADP